MFKITCFVVTLFALIYISYGQWKKPHENVSKNNNKIVTTKFNPEGAIDIPFDSLFISVEIINLQKDGQNILTMEESL